jgi:hypothetical protein
MPNNSLPQQDKLSPSQIKTLASELHEFKKTDLYAHYLSHFQMLYDDTVDRIVEEPLKAAETLYTREAWIGEARTAKLMIGWFEMLQGEIQTELDVLG